MFSDRKLKGFMGWLNFRIDAGLFQAIIHDVYDEARYSVLALRAARMATGSLRRPSMEVGGGISLSTLHPATLSPVQSRDYILQSLYPAELPSKAS